MVDNSLSTPTPPPEESKRVTQSRATSRHMDRKKSLLTKDEHEADLEEMGTMWQKMYQALTYEGKRSVCGKLLLLRVGTLI